MTKKIKRNEDKKGYTGAGKNYDSVTTVLQILNKPGLNNWRGNIGNAEADRISNESKELGTKLHAAAEKIARGKKYQDPGAGQLFDMIENYRDWFNMNVDSVIDVELIVSDERYKYAGTLDLFAILKDDPVPAIIDIKTGKKYREHGYQLAAYKEALNKKITGTIGRSIIVHVPKDGGACFTQDYTGSHNKDYRMFLYCLELYRDYLK